MIYDCKISGHMGHPDGTTSSCYICGKSGLGERWNMVYVPGGLVYKQPPMYNTVLPIITDGTIRDKYGNIVETINGNPILKCECGSDSVSSPYHSSWCPKA